MLIYIYTYTFVYNPQHRTTYVYRVLRLVLLYVNIYIVKHNMLYTYKYRICQVQDAYPVA